MRFCLGIFIGAMTATIARAVPSPDIPTESGVSQMGAKHYQRFPKWWVSGLTLVDLDGDGFLDLHLASHSGPTIPALAALNDEKGHFTAIDPAMTIPRGPRQRADLPYPGGEIRLACDLNEDGKLDLLCSWHDGGGVLYINESKRPELVFKPSDLLDPFSRATAIADIDGDGRADYLADERSNIQAILGNSKKTSIPALKESCAIPVDLDGDGQLDLLVSQRGYNPTRRLLLDNDGKADVLVDGRNFLYVLRGAGDGTFDVMNEKWGITTLASSAVDEGFSFGDINNDGALDLITCARGANENEKSAAILRNDLPKQHWLRVRPIGAAGNRSATGAKIRIADPATGKF